MTNKTVTTSDFVTFEIGDQLFGVPIDEVQDVFKPQRLTPVPLSQLSRWNQPRSLARRPPPPPQLSQLV